MKATCATNPFKTYIIDDQAGVVRVKTPLKKTPDTISLREASVSGLWSFAVAYGDIEIQNASGKHVLEAVTNCGKFKEALQQVAAGQRLSATGNRESFSQSATNNQFDSRVTAAMNRGTFEGTLVIQDFDITEFPRDIRYITGDLLFNQTLKTNTERTGVRRLPEGLCVLGTLRLGNSYVEAIPENLTVGGTLDLGWADRITSIPESTIVNGTIITPSCSVFHDVETARTNMNMKSFRRKLFGRTP